MTCFKYYLFVRTFRCKFNYKSTVEIIEKFTFKSHNLSILHLQKKIQIPNFSKRKEKNDARDIKTLFRQFTKILGNILTLGETKNITRRRICDKIKNSRNS